MPNNDKYIFNKRTEQDSYIKNAKYKPDISKDYRDIVIYNSSFNFSINEIKDNGIIIKNEYFSIFKPNYKYILKVLDSNPFNLNNKEVYNLFFERFSKNYVYRNLYNKFNLKITGFCFIIKNKSLIIYIGLCLKIHILQNMNYY